MLPITADEVSLVLDATNHLSTKLYDIFAIKSAGAIKLVTGPAWTNSTTRSSALAIKGGVWTNNASLTHAYNNSTDFGAIAQFFGTYLGTFYATANGQTGMAFNPSAASGGSNPILGLYNGYNRVPISSVCNDFNASWSLTSDTWAMLDSGATGSGANNRVSWVDGLAQSPAAAAVVTTTSSSGSSQGSFGILFNATTGTPTIRATASDAGAVGQLSPAYSPPILGFNYAQGMNVNPTNTGTQSVFAPNFVTLTVEM